MYIASEKAIGLRLLLKWPHTLLSSCCTLVAHPVGLLTLLVYTGCLPITTSRISHTLAPFLHRKQAVHTKRVKRHLILTFIEELDKIRTGLRWQTANIILNERNITL